MVIDAVRTSVGTGNSFAYDANGNMITRKVGAPVYNLTYDAENRLVSVSGAATASFLYDGDGMRVKGTAGGVTSYYPNQYYEVADGTVKKYYYAGAQRVAMTDDLVTRTLLGDHLGRGPFGRAVTVAGMIGPRGRPGEVRYKAFGASRFTSGATPTTFRYTGQREEASIGLYYYGARWCDPALGHFVHPDTMVPNAGNALDYQRYGYARFNPLKYNDPSGHCSANQFSPDVAENQANSDCWVNTIVASWDQSSYWADRYTSDEMSAHEASVESIKANESAAISPATQPRKWCASSRSSSTITTPAGDASAAGNVKAGPLERRIGVPAAPSDLMHSLTSERY